VQNISKRYIGKPLNYNPKTNGENKMNKKIAILSIIIIANIAFWGLIYTRNIQETKTSSYDNGYNIGLIVGNHTGYSDGYLQGTKDGAGSGYNIRDPTYQEMLSFIASDQTNTHEYSGSYDCYDFTNELCNNAFNNGYRAGFVYIEFLYDAHALVCFRTVDKGLVFIEPQSDDIMNVVIGEHYWNRAVYEAPTYDDMIMNYDVIW
jgi:hypothetical protein